MKLLVNDKEIAKYLVDQLDYMNLANSINATGTNITEAIDYAIGEKRKGLGKWQKKKHKIKAKIKSAVERDLKEYFENVKATIKKEKEKNYRLVHKNLDTVLNRLGYDKILEKYKKSNHISGFIKGVGIHIDPTAELVRRTNFSDVNADCLLRNTVGNEQFLISKIDNRLPFWFIDSGYTNFLETHKKWHRLTRNHIHWGGYFRAPVNRLDIFPKFPEPWRQGGDKILVIEPGPFAANIMHVDVKQWKYQVEEEIRKYSDKKIIFREKAPKKQRAPLYKHLLDEDYYCLININSNAAVEALWAGIPVITLNKHISNQVTRQQIKSINDLYRGSLAEWLAMLSYSQFTYEELTNGTAYRLLMEHGNA